MKVVWIKDRHGKPPKLHSMDFDDDLLGLTHALQMHLNSYTERVDIIMDKGEGADVRQGKSFDSIKELHRWMVEDWKKYRAEEYE